MTEQSPERSRPTWFVRVCSPITGRLEQRCWGPIGDRAPLLYLLAALVAASFFITAQQNSVVGNIQGSDLNTYTVGAVTPIFPIITEDTLADINCVWSQLPLDGETGECGAELVSDTGAVGNVRALAKRVGTSHAIADSLNAVAIFLLLGAAVTLLRRRIKGELDSTKGLKGLDQSDADKLMQQRSTYDNVLGGASCLVVFYLAFDLMENVQVFAFTATPNGLRIAWLLATSTVLKNLALFATLLALPVAAFAWRRMVARHRLLQRSAEARAGDTLPAVTSSQLNAEIADRAHRWWIKYRHLRIHFVLLLLFALVLLSSVLPEQIPDAIRTWSDPNWSVALLGLLATAFLGLTFWASLSWLPQNIRIKDEAPTGRRLMLIGILILALAGAVELAQILVFKDEKWFTVHGLFVPAALLVVTGLLTFFAGARAKQGKRSWLGGYEDVIILREDATVRPRANPTVDAALATAPFVIVGLAMLRALTAPAFGVFDDPTAWRFVLMWWVVALAVISVSTTFLFSWLRKHHHSRGGSSSSEAQIAMLSLLALSSAFAVFVVFSPVAFTRHLGIVGVLAMGLVFLTVVATYSLGLTLKNRPSKALRLIGFRTTPIILFVLVWGVVAGQLDPGGYHDVRVISFDPEAATSALYRDAEAEPSSTTGLLAVEDIGGLPFEAWLAKNCLDESPAGRGDIPMVFVSSSGGGIRAAYWTTAVLDQLTEAFDLESEADSPVGVDCDDPNNRLFAISGTSGGALGAATYAIQLASPSSDPDWYDDYLGGDYLSPTAAWLMVVDSPRTLFRFGSPDRAEILERSWEASNEDLELGLREFQAEHPVPLLFFNGSTVESGCRFNASVVDMGIDPPRFVFDPTNSTVHNVAPYRVPANCRAVDFVKQKRAIPAAEATSDLNDFLCDEEDMPLSTAVLLSARFPIVSPVGRISTEVKDADCKTPIDPSSDLLAAERRSLAPISTFVVDGGYIDRTGSDAIVDVYLSVLDSVNAWNAAHADQDVRILPVLLQLENGYQRAEAVAAPDRPSEGMEVPQAFFSSVSGRGPASLQASIAAFSEPVVGVDPAITRYARIAPTAHPGIQAPLGWAMSSFARDDLVRQACGALGASEVAPVINLVNPLWSEQACEARSALALAGGRGDRQ